MLWLTLLTFSISDISLFSIIGVNVNKILCNNRTLWWNKRWPQGQTTHCGVTWLFQITDELVFSFLDYFAHRSLHWPRVNGQTGCYGAMRPSPGVTEKKNRCSPLAHQQQRSHLSEAPWHSPALLVHLRAPHNFLPSLEQHQWWKLLGEWRCWHLVPAEQGVLICMWGAKRHRGNWFKRVLLFGNLSIASDVHFAKLQASTVVPIPQNRSTEVTPERRWRHKFTRGWSQPYLSERSAYTEAKDWHSGDQLAKNSTIHVTRPSLASSSWTHGKHTL